MSDGYKTLVTLYCGETRKKPVLKPVQVTQAHKEFRQRMLDSIAGLEPRIHVELQPKPPRPYSPFEKDILFSMGITLGNYRKL
ncbi:hypothetical protein KY348_05890 [Candidatus Woesearchaeota archaeon]|nr:hypothetical protein [Candidatus Woesearchaeota archaeon]